MAGNGLAYNSSMKTGSLLLTLALLSASTRAKKDILQNTVPFLEACNQDLVRSFGMVGSPEPHASELEMCPSTKQSCCLKRDQLMVYNKWLNMKERDFIRKLYEDTRGEYVKFLHMLGEVEVMIKAALHGLRNKRISNCKSLGQRILYFEVSSITPMVKKNIDKMRAFLETSYEGVYCSLCDHSYHSNINMESKTVSYCDGFCRSMIEHGLPFLLFFHVDIVKFANLVSKYLVTCDFKGDYDTEALIPKNMIFYADDLTTNQLDDCRRYRNTKEWMAYCSPVCEHFNIARVEDFYLPNILRIREYNLWIRRQIDSRKTEHMHNPMFSSLANKKAMRAGGAGPNRGSGSKSGAGNGSGSGSSGSSPDDFPHPYHFRENHSGGFLKKKRILLSENLKDYPRQSKEKKEKDRGNLVFVAQLTSKIQLQHFKTVFAGDGGVCLYEKGLSSLINESVYNEIKMLFHLSGMVKAPGGILHAIKNSLGLNGVSNEELKHIDKLNNSYNRIIKSVPGVFVQTVIGWGLLFLFRN